MKKRILSTVLSFLLIGPGLTWAEEIRLPLGLEWGDSPGTVFSTLKSKCSPRHEEESRAMGCLVIDKDSPYPYLLYCKFDKNNKLKYIDKSIYVYGNGSYKKNMSDANLVIKLTSYLLQKEGMLLESTEEEKGKNIHNLSSLNTLITMDIQPGDDSHNSFFKDKVVVVNMLYIDPAFQKGPQGDPLSEAARIEEELKNLKK